MSTCRCGITHLGYSKSEHSFVNKNGVIHECLLDKIEALKQVIKAQSLQIEYYKHEKLLIH